MSACVTGCTMSATIFALAMIIIKSAEEECRDPVTKNGSQPLIRIDTDDMMITSASLIGGR